MPRQGFTVLAAFFPTHSHSGRSSALAVVSHRPGAALEASLVIPSSTRSHAGRSQMTLRCGRLPWPSFKARPPLLASILLVVTCCCGPRVLCEWPTACLRPSACPPPILSFPSPATPLPQLKVPSPYRQSSCNVVEEEMAWRSPGGMHPSPFCSHVLLVCGCCVRSTTSCRAGSRRPPCGQALSADCGHHM